MLRALFLYLQKKWLIFWPAEKLDVLLNTGILLSLIIPRSNHRCSTVGGVTKPDVGECLVNLCSTQFGLQTKAERFVHARQ
jgi:hypothetical protein